MKKLLLVLFISLNVFAVTNVGDKTGSIISKATQADINAQVNKAFGAMYFNQSFPRYEWFNGVAMVPFGSGGGSGSAQVFSAQVFGGNSTENLGSIYFQYISQDIGTGCFSVVTDSASGTYIEATADCSLAITFGSSNATTSYDAGFVINPTDIELDGSFSDVPFVKQLCNLNSLGIQGSTNPCTFYRAVTTGDIIYLMGPLGLQAEYPEKFYISVASIGGGSAGGGGIQTVGPVLDNHLSAYDGVTGDFIKDSGINLIDVVTMSATPTQANRPVLTTGTTKEIIEAGYTIPNLVCPSGEILKSDGTNYVCSADGGGSGGGITGPITTTINTVALFANNTGNLLKESSYTIPPNACPNGEILQSDGTNFICAAGGGGSGSGDVVGPASSIDNDIATFNGVTGKLIKDSGISSAQITTNQNDIAILQGISADFVTGPASSSTNTIALYADSTGKLIKETPYTLPTVSCSSGEILESDGTNFICAVPSGGGGSGDVTGPGTTPGLGNYPLAFFHPLNPNEIAYNIQLKASPFSPILYLGATAANGGTGAPQLDFVSPFGGAISIKTSTGPSTYGLILPDAAPADDQILQADASGNLSWINTPTGGGGGSGDVVGPATSLDSTLSAFDGTTGKLLKDSLISLDEVSFISGVHGANEIPYFANGTDGRLGTTLIDFRNVVEASANFTAANRVILAADAFKGIKASAYTFPSGSCPVGQILKSDGTNFTCQADGGGSGDVVGPATSLDSTLSAFDGTTGKLLKDSLISLDEVSFISGVHGANEIPYFANGTDGRLGTTLIDFRNVVEASANFTAANRVILAADAFKGIKASAYTFPSGSCPVGQILKSDGTNFTCQADGGGTGDVVGPATSVGDNVAFFNGTTGKLIKETAGFSTSTLVTNTNPSAITAGNLLSALNRQQIQDSGIKSSDVLLKPAITPTAGRPVVWGPVGALFEGDFDLPTGTGLNGQVMISDGTGGSSWFTPTGLGDVIGPATSTNGTLAAFNGTTGKLLQDSLIPFANVATMPAPPVSSNRPFVSQGVTKTLATTTYAIPNGIGTQGQVLTSSGTDAVWANSAGGGGGGDVVGPASSLNLQIPYFSGTTGKLLANSTFTIDLVPQMNPQANFANELILSAAAGTAIKSTGYQLPATICGNGLILKSDGTNFTCQADGGGTTIPTCSGSQRVSGNGTSLSCIDNTYAVAPGTTIDWASAHVFYQAITTNQTYTFTSQSNGQVLILSIENTTGGDLTATLPTSKWPGGTVVNTVKANSTTIFTISRINNANYVSAIEDMK